MDDHQLAAHLARTAGHRLVELRERLVAQGVDAQDLKAQGDRLAHEYLMGELAAHRSADGVLSEEGSGSDGPSGTRRLDMERVWIVDPLDGTREFGEYPRTDWAVHVALVVDGRPVAGAVALPAQDVVLSTGSGAGPGGGSGVLAEVPAVPRVLVSRSRPPAIAKWIAQCIGGELVEMGSAGAKAAAVVQGRAEVYPHAGGQYEWDSCAPVAVALAAGYVATRLDGSELVYNNADPYLPDLLVCHPDLHDRVRAAIDSFPDS